MQDKKGGNVKIEKNKEKKYDSEDDTYHKNPKHVINRGRNIEKDNKEGRSNIVPPTERSRGLRPRVKSEQSDKYNKYKNLAKRKPIVLSDSSTDESSSSDDFPSPSPVRRDEYSNIVRKMRELEKQLKRR